ASSNPLSCLYAVFIPAPSQLNGSLGPPAYSQEGPQHAPKIEVPRCRDSDCLPPTATTSTCLPPRAPGRARTVPQEGRRKADELRPIFGIYIRPSEEASILYAAVFPIGSGSFG